MGYAFVAARAVRRGPSVLLAAAAAALLLVVALAILLGIGFRVPSMARLLLFTIAFLGPSIVVPTALLWPRAHRPPGVADGTIYMALGGSIAGLAAGWVVIVYVLPVW